VEWQARCSFHPAINNDSESLVFEEWL
jgi:hypothetical protein